MHQSAIKRMEWFIENYIPQDKHVKVLDVGSYNVNGCYTSLLSNYDVEYVGLDIESGPNVDVVVADPYDWKELEDSSFDFVISGNAFEHIQYPWLTMEQIYKKLKPEGFTCILAPFCLGEHRYPTDCYRYYPDGMKALAEWAGLNIIQATTGGLPEEIDELHLNLWIPSENYDDTVLIAGKLLESVKGYPKFASEFRGHMIYTA